MLVPLKKAAELCGRSPLTIRDWVARGHLRAEKPPAGDFHHWLIDTDDLLVAATERMRRYRQRPIKPGPGRGKHGKPAGPLMTWEDRHPGE